MKTSFFQFKTHVIIFLIVFVSAPFFQLINYLINPLMIGKWDLHIYLFDQLISELFLFVLSIILSKQVWTRIRLTKQSVEFFLFGKKLRAIFWEEISSVQIQKRYFDYILLFNANEKKTNFNIHVNFTKINLLYDICSNLSIKSELKIIIEKWRERS